MEHTSRRAHHNRIYTDYFFDGTYLLFLNFLFSNPGSEFCDHKV